MTETIDKTKPSAGAKWQFDAAVTEAFPNMLARSIPDYHTMRRLTFDLGLRFVQPRTDIVDLGCSRGDALAPFVDRLGCNNRFVGLEVSEPMLDAARQRFRLMGDSVEIRRHDLREPLGGIFPSLVLGILTLQFVPIECRQRVVADVFRLLRPGGAFIVVEKILAPDAASNDVLVRTYHDLKVSNGYTPEQVDAKRASLQGVLVPQTAAANETMLRAEGFAVTQFWQALNFAGWLAVKPKAGG